MSILSFPLCVWSVFRCTYHPHVIWASLFLFDVCKNLSGTLNPLRHGTALTHRDQHCSLTHTHNTWTVCYIAGDKRLSSHSRSCVLSVDKGCTLMTTLKSLGLHTRIWTTFSCFIFNRLFEKCDVSEGAEKQHHFVIFISDRGHLHVKPYWCSCRRH